MVRRLLLLPVLIGIAVLVSGDRLIACVCIVTPACTSLANADAIFIAHVIEVEPSGPRSRFNPADDGPHARIRVRIQEVFVGDVEGDVDLFPATTALMDCYAHFQLGETYLVLASRGPNRGELVVGSCGGSRPVAHVPQEDLAYFRNLPAVPPATGVIRGTALLYDSSGPSGSDTPTPVAGVVIVGLSENGIVTATTDGDGRYRIDAPPGRYTLSAAPPDGLHVRGPEATWTVNHRDPRGCGVADVPLFVNGRIGGRLVAADGTPVPHMTVAAFSSPRDGSFEGYQAAATDAGGHFEIGGLPAGEYVVGLELASVRAGNALRHLPRVFFPGTLDPAATRSVALPRGARVELGAFTLPPGTSTVTIAGTVRDLQNRAVPDAFVSVFGVDMADARLLATTSTGSGGTFKAAVLAGGRYRVHVMRSGLPFAEVTVPAFEITGDTHVLDIVVPRGDRDVTTP
jgi:hypothetical protein